MIVRRTFRFLDERLAAAGFLRAALRKVFPDHWSFMLGEIALYAFTFLVLSGTWLAFFFDDSDQRVRYHGAYPSLDGRWVPRSYASVLQLSFATPLGLFVRQAHHWAAVVFVGAIIFHMCRIFFTGAFRKPRELNWVVGLSLLLLAMADGFSGYSLPGDLLSGAGLRIAYSVAESVPVVGTWLAFLFFGGLFPSDGITGRLFFLHVFVVPLSIMLALGIHLGMVWRQKHTQFAGPGRTEENVAGSPVWPLYALKSFALMLATFGTFALLGGLFEINPIWVYGPYDPWNVASPAQPDWYVAWLDGALRVGPAWAIRLAGHTLSTPFWTGVLLPGLLFGPMFAWPFIEARLTGDNAAHNLLDMPYEVPWRTGLGVGVLTFATLLGFVASDDIQAKVWHVEVEKLLVFYQVSLFVLPVVFGWLTVVICREVRARIGTRAGRERVVRAAVVRNAAGGYDEENVEVAP